MSRPAFKVTAAKRKSVELMKADGWSDERIAAQIGCSRPTLLKHFAFELEFGADKVRSEQLANLRRMSKRNVAAAKALLARSDVTPPPGAPPDVKAPKLGKKEELDAAAQAPPPDEWGNLVRH